MSRHYNSYFDFSHALGLLGNYLNIFRFPWHVENIKNLGVGIDIEDIDRFRKLDMAEHRLFLDKIFTKNEMKFCFSKKKPASCLAVRYAGKEAITKALFSIGKEKLDYKMLEILEHKNNMPNVNVNSVESCNLQVSISLSHSRDKAIAFAVVMEANQYE